MWKKEFTEELTTLYDLYEDKFDYPPDEYEELEFSIISYDEFIRYLKISLENNITLPEATDYDTVIKELISSYKEYGRFRINCPHCSGRMVKIREDDNSYTIRCKKHGCVSVNIKPPK